MGPDRMLTEATIREAGLGYLPQRYTDQPSRWGLPYRHPDALVTLQRSIVIPTIVRGQVWGMKMRPFDPEIGRPDEFKHKYVAVMGSVPALLGSHAIVPGDRVPLTEGEFDRWLIWQELADPAFDRVVACTMGAATHRLNRYWLWQLAGAEHIYSIRDQDKAGQIARAYYEREARIQRLTCHFPPGGLKDPTAVLAASRIRGAGNDLATWLYELISGEVA